MYALIPYERNVILEKMRQRVEDAFKESEEELEEDGEKQDKVEAAAEQKEKDADKLFAQQQQRCESRTSTASAGLSMILDNYGDEDLEEDNAS
jgi:hypothetical protein